MTSEITPADSPRRYEALDSLRGICACMVVLYHLRPDGWITSTGLVRNGWMFVDFFFVLSGFVIAASYGERLAGGFSVARFMALRLGRVYPLHVFVIALILVFNLLSAGEPFIGKDNASSLIANLLLLQRFGPTPDLTWNGPSWSIAVEVWVYLIFAFTVTWRRRIDAALFIALAAGSLLALVALSDVHLESMYRLALVRCLYGFSLGVVVWLLHKKFAEKSSTIVEALVAGSIISFIALTPDGPLTFLAPPLFAVAVFVFAKGRGVVSSVLELRPLKVLGQLSYAIYMIHLVALARYFDLLAIAGNWSGRSLVAGDGQSLRNDDIVLTELLTIGAVAFTIFLAWFAWRFVEMPARDWSRRRFGVAKTERTANASFDDLRHV